MTDTTTQPRGLTDAERAKLDGRTAGHQTASWETEQDALKRTYWRKGVATRAAFLEGFRETHVPGTY